MSLDSKAVDDIPVWAWAAPVAGCVLLAVKSAGIIPIIPAHATLVLCNAAALPG